MVFSSCVHGGSHLSCRHAILYHTDQSCHPGVPPTDTPNADGLSLSCMSYYQEPLDCRYCGTRHTNTLRSGKDNSVGISSVDALSSGSSASVASLATHSQDHALTLPQLWFCCVPVWVPVMLWDRIFLGETEYIHVLTPDRKLKINQSTDNSKVQLGEP